MSICGRCGTKTVVLGGSLCARCLLRLGLEDQQTDAAGAWATLPQLISPIGRGPNGVVHLSRRPGPDPALVTVKFVDRPVDAGRFVALIMNTVDCISRLNVRSAGTLLEAGADGDRAFVVARYVPGPGISAYVRKGRRPAAETLALLLRLCDAVRELHEAGIVHGSLKSPNVIVVDKSNLAVPILLDVGVKAAIDEALVGAATGPVSSITGDVLALQRLATELLCEDAGVAEPRDILQTCIDRPFESARELAAALSALTP